MPAKYATHISRKTTSQKSPILGKKQVKNSAGGYVYELDKWARLRRFLILGTDGGTYYAGEKKLTRENAIVIEACLADDAARTVAEIVNVSDEGRAPKNDPALFALAIAASALPDARKLAMAALPKVARIPTHLFTFASYCDELRGWGPGLKKAVGKWYNDLTPQKLVYEVVKYQQRDGWSNRDMFRLAHPKAKDSIYSDIFRYIVKGDYHISSEESEPAMKLVEGFERAKTEKDHKVIAQLIRDYGLTREMIPTDSLKSKEVWDALLQNMPLTAMIRTLNRMTAVGLLAPMSEAVKIVIDRLHDIDWIRKSRVHPLNVLVAMKTYDQGHGEKGKLSWTPIKAITDAMDDTFYLAFKNVEPSGKKTLIALDVSGSMGSGMGNLPLSCREAAAAMALVTARVENPADYLIVSFSTGSGSYLSKGSRWSNYASGIEPLNISPKATLESVLRMTSNLPFGGTDCALPALYAEDKGLPVDGIAIYTDNETWAGKLHPSQALTRLRNKTGKRVRQAVVAFTPTKFTIADPQDADSLDVVGFDVNSPAVISDFIAGRV